VVIAGTLDALSLVAEPLKTKGAKRILPLDVSGAFHSGLMASAQKKLSEKIAQVTLSTGEIRVVMNVPGDYVDGVDEMRQMLVAQLTSPVRWEKGIRAMEEQSLDAYIEMGPGKTLSGMNKRIGTVAPTYSLEKVADLELLGGILCNC
jgi:[acyl-carrier-protein] S-malonyltransferase